MSDEYTGIPGLGPADEEVIEIDLAFASMRRFQAEFSQNLATDGLFIDTGEPLGSGSVVRFRVVLPEDFVYVEGTAVVEWSRAADTAGEEVPGMALRFVAMSPQNQELVEQLVEAHIESGGSPFDLDYRPAVTDYPTDALEGLGKRKDVTGEFEPTPEKYRVTIRSKQSEITEAALQALVEADPGETETAHGADSLDSVDESGDGVETSESTGIGAVLDSLDIGRKAPMEPDEQAEGIEQAETPAAGEEPEVEPEVSPPEEVHLHDEERPLSDDLEFVKAPADFDDGPEVMESPEAEEEIGSPAFDVSLPVQDDEPDTTPVLPDEGGDNITVTPAEETEEPRRKGRGWLLSVVAIVVVAAAVVVWWPTIVGWLGGVMGDDSAPEIVEEIVVEPEPVSEVETGESAAAEGAAEAVVDSDLGEDPQADDDRAVGTVTQEIGSPAKADTVLAIDVESRDGATMVTIRGNGDLGEGSINLSSLASPPRALVRIVGISNEYRPYAIDARTPEVTKVRIGHHEETRPPELWVVLDLAAPGVAVAGVDIRGDTAELMIARR